MRQAIANVFWVIAFIFGAVLVYPLIELARWIETGEPPWVK